MPRNIACAMKGFMTKAEMGRPEMTPMTRVNESLVQIKGSLKKKKKK